MQHDSRAYLWDVRQAADAILDIVAGIDLKNYAETEVIHSDVERKFQIIGEALNQLSKAAASIAYLFRMTRPHAGPGQRRDRGLPPRVQSMARTAIHPGQQRAEQLKELGMSAAELGRRHKVPTNRITGILNGQRAVTGDSALRLTHFFGTTPQFWLNLQKLYELRLAEAKAGAAIRRLPPLHESEKSEPCRSQAGAT